MKINSLDVFRIILILGIIFLLAIGNTEGWGWLVFILIITT